MRSVVQSLYYSPLRTEVCLRLRRSRSPGTWRLCTIQTAGYTYLCLEIISSYIH